MLPFIYSTSDRAGFNSKVSNKPRLLTHHQKSSHQIPLNLVVKGCLRFDLASFLYLENYNGTLLNNFTSAGRIYLEEAQWTEELNVERISQDFPSNGSLRLKIV